MSEIPVTLEAEQTRPSPRMECDPRYVVLVRRRTRFSWVLTIIMLVVYFGYILLIAFRRDLLAIPIGGGVTSIGIPIGIGVILLGIMLTGIYVHRANHDFDPKLDMLLKEYLE